MTEQQQAAIQQAAEDVSKVYDLIAWGHTELAADILKGTRTALRQALNQQPADEEIQRLRALVRAQQITIDKLEQQPAYRAVKTVHEGKPYYVSEQQPAGEPVAYEYFKDWMVKEMPPMTTIGRPEWWAKRIYDRFIHVARPQPAAPAYTADQIYQAWHKTGIDIAGVEWTKFAAALAATPEQKGN